MRILYLFLAAVLTPVAVCALHAVGYAKVLWARAFQEQIGLFPVFGVAVVATMLSGMFPDFVRGVNLSFGHTGRWSDDDQPTVHIFLFSSFLLLPLIAVFFPRDDSFSSFYVSRGAFVWPYFLLWWIHGAINARHVATQLRRELADDKLAKRNRYAKKNTDSE